MQAESQSVEFKSEYSESVKKEIVAFLNTDGGRIYIGRKNDGSYSGLSDLDGTMLKVSNVIHNAIKPDASAFTKVSPQEKDGKAFVLVEVLQGSARPYYLKEKGPRPEGVFVRHGSASVPASEERILSMIKESSGDNFEAAICVEQGLTFDYASAFFQKRGVDFGGPQMRSLGFLANGGGWTNLAFLFSDQCKHSIKTAVFDGSDRKDFQDRAEFSGCILKQMQEASDFIDRWNRTHWQFDGSLERKESRDYPKDALRELLVNCIIHRDYSFGYATLISMDSEKIEFISYGGLAPGVSLSDIEHGISAQRNPGLSSIFYRLKLIEAYGTGIKKVQAAYRGFYRPPMFDVSDHAFSATIFNMHAAIYQNESPQMLSVHDSGLGYGRPSFGQGAASPVKDSPLAERAKKILHLLERQGKASRKEIQEVLGVSQATAILVLRQMLSEGLLKKVGGGKETVYVIPVGHLKS